jgi:plastocyanin
MKRRALIATMVALAAAVPWPARAATTSVSIKGRAYHPADITIRAGTIVQWSNDESDLPFTKTMHTVTADDDSFSSGVMAPGDTFTLSFPTAGTYPYHCSIHANMHGSVTVTGVRSSPKPTASSSARASSSPTAKARSSKSPRPSVSVTPSVAASDGQAVGGSGSTSSSAGAIISIAIIAIAVLVGAGYFVYVKFLRAPV